MSTSITIQNVRLSYVYVFGDGKTNDEGKRSWSLTALIPKNHPQISAIKEAITAAKTKEAKKIGTSGIKSPLLDGDAKDDDGAYRYKGEENRGHFLLRCVNYNRRPAVVDQKVAPILDPEALYSGCYGNVQINFYGYAGKTNKGISPGLDAVQKVRDGERLSAGGVDPKSIFSAIDEDFLA